MGSLAATDMLAHTDEDTALRWHLQHNHYPPVPLSMVPACKAAIDAYRDDEQDREIALPAGVTWRGKRTAPADAIVSGHHLESFVDAYC